MPRNKRLTKSIRKPSSRTAKTWNGHPPISRNSRLRLQNGKPATSAACNWSDFDSAKMATSWSCKSPFSSTENRPTEPLKSIVGTRRNTTECRARPAQRPQPPSLRCEIDRSHRNLRPGARASAPPARNEQTIVECRVRYPACCNGYPRLSGDRPQSVVNQTSRSEAKYQLEAKTA